ncbi:type II secretion system protein N [Pollutimonas thiosulfatoxidans]|uniref:Type II secretion system protein N n=1 Tax=Pollutimonas thiosulfatoxidans TaxID=2028345 RepID=A0A410GA99_9BURK|nr:type II secretion system protein N [Pollutimonas thiosulfatoxidans]QAA93242.1 hypothetical protein CKA81_04875 [Pollutimonas thiosulfatoxidans]
MSRARRAAWLVLLLAVGLTAALWVLPARWAMAWIPASSPVIITDATGTLWHAKATMAVGVDGLRRSLPDPVAWRLAFDGGPQLVVTHPWLRGSLKLRPSWRGLRMSAQSLHMPASVLTTLHGIFNTLDPEGEVLLSWPELTLGSRSISSNGSKGLLSAQWRNAASSLTRIRPMGEYTLLVTEGGDDKLALALATKQGPWMMEGTGTLTLSGRLQFDGNTWVDESAGADTRDALQGVLDAMAPRSGPDGHTLLKLR